MKKIVVIFLCLTLAVAAILPTVVFAEESASSSAEDIIYFLNPTAITAVGDYLFVADKIEDNRSAIHYFNLSSGTPVFINTLELPQNVTNLLAKGSSLYVVTSKKVLTANVTASKLELTETTFEIANDSSDLIDFTIYNDKAVILTTAGLYCEDGYLENLDDTVAAVTAGDYVYYLYNGGAYSDINPIARRTGNMLNKTPSDVFNNYLNWQLYNNLQAKGLFAWEGNEVAIFGEHIIYYSVAAGSQYNLDLLGSFNDFAILDADASNNRLYVLNDNHQIVIYQYIKDSSTVQLTEKAVIGDDKVQQAVPQTSQYTSFTLVRSKGYPTNIVFKTTSQNSVANIKTDASEYIVIGYDGDASSNFYYVFVRDDNGYYKFGWVKKSDTATSVFNDDKLEVVNTNLSNDGNVQYKTVFSSLNTVWIFDVPCSQFEGHAFSQTASNMTEVTILQEFVEITSDGQIAWLYVEYESNSATQRGFVKKQEVGSFYPTVEQTAVIAYCKINSTLFSSVKLYMYGDPDKMTDDNLAVYTKTVTDSEGEKIVVEETVPPLHSGQKVSVISEENGIALVQIQRGDGAVAYGYLYSDRLIDAHALTTNATVGLVLLVVAIALVVALAVIFVRRRKKLKADAEPAPAEKE